MVQTTNGKPRAPMVLQDLGTNGKPKATPNATAELDRLRAENAALKAEKAERNKPKPLRCKVSEKGALSLYGLTTRFPVTLYANQWERIFEIMPELQAFILAHANELKRKEEG